jgi:hypothetical protein
MKKDFCADTSVVFHAEFSRLISIPVKVFRPNCLYHLLIENEFECDALYWSGYQWTRYDNAKAQFKCSLCNRSWTSMRARIGYKISQPQPVGFVVMKIFGQKCQICKTHSDALWYMGRNTSTNTSSTSPRLVVLVVCRRSVPRDREPR